MMAHPHLFFPLLPLLSLHRHTGQVCVVPGEQQRDQKPQVAALAGVRFSATAWETTGNLWLYEKFVARSSEGKFGRKAKHMANA
jgi:hypothetical protein